jgi:hypothetical protein
VQDLSWKFWNSKRGDNTVSHTLVDLQFAVLRYNSYKGSNSDMLAQWRKAGYPTLDAIVIV